MKLRFEAIPKPPIVLQMPLEDISTDVELEVGGMSSQRSLIAGVCPCCSIYQKCLNYDQKSELPIRHR